MAVAQIHAGPAGIDSRIGTGDDICQHIGLREGMAVARQLRIAAEHEPFSVATHPSGVNLLGRKDFIDQPGLIGMALAVHQQRHQMAVEPIGVDAVARIGGIGDKPAQKFIVLLVSGVKFLAQLFRSLAPGKRDHGFVVITHIPHVGAAGVGFDTDARHLRLNAVQPVEHG